MPRGLCVGGYADGLWMDCDSPYLHVPIQYQSDRIIPFEESKALPDKVEVKTEIYRMHEFKTGHDTLYMLVPVGTTLIDAVRTLFNGYKQGSSWYNPKRA